MLKKIAIGALLTGLVAVLILGAVIRTNAKSGESAGETGRRGQAVAYETADTLAQGTGRGGGGRWAEQGSLPQAGVQLNVPQADVQPGEWSRVTGTVTGAAGDLVEIRTASGEVVPFEGRPLSFALGQGFSLAPGDVVTLDGFDEDGEFKLGKVTNLTSGASITLRDATGRPAWSGQGRRQG